MSKDIKKLTAKELKDTWKSYTWVVYVYGQSSMNDLRRIEELEKEMYRRDFKGTDLKRWLKKEKEKFANQVKEGEGQ
jgi:hypothetical protein